jgi:tRNA(fMet)-specific endonuclease VapC
MRQEPESQASGFALVDTDVLSYWQKGDSRGRDYAEAVADMTLVISFQTVAEQLRWAAERGWSSARRERLEAFLRSFIVYPYSLDLARVWAALMAETRSQGRALSTGDAWIAATGRLLSIPLATHNRTHFETLNGCRSLHSRPASRNGRPGLAEHRELARAQGLRDLAGFEELLEELVHIVRRGAAPVRYAASALAVDLVRVTPLPARH